MPEPLPKPMPDPRKRQRQVVAIALSAVAGYVDCWGYIALSHVFTAQMSGNTVLIAVHWAAGDYGAALLQTFTIGMFLAGLVLSGIAIETAFRRRLRRVLALAMAIEALLLGAILVGGVVPKDESNIYLAVALTAMAMGTQNTSLRMARVLGVYTTHITGTITRLSEDIVSSAFGRRGRGKEIGLNAALWATFLLGALAAALLMPHAAPGRLLALPIGAILLVGALDLRAPLAQLDS